MLIRCCLMHTGIIIHRYFLYLVHMFLSMSTPRSVYVIYFHCYFPFQNNRIIPLKQTIVFLHVLFSFSQKFSSGLAFDYFLANFYLVLPVKVLLMKVCNEVLTFCSYLRDKKSRKTLFWMMKIDSIILETIISY